MKSDVPLWRTFSIQGFRCCGVSCAEHRPPGPSDSIRQCRRADVADRCIIIRPSSVVVSLGWTMLNDTAKSTSRKSVARQIDTATVRGPVRPPTAFFSFSSVFAARSPAGLGRRAGPADPPPRVSISIRRMPITRRPSVPSTTTTSTIKRFIIAADRSPTSNRIQIVVRLTVASIVARAGVKAERPDRSSCPARHGEPRSLTDCRQLNAVCLYLFRALTVTLREVLFESLVVARREKLQFRAV